MSSTREAFAEFERIVRARFAAKRIESAPKSYRNRRRDLIAAVAYGDGAADVAEIATFALGRNAMQIYGPSGAHAAHAVGRPHAPRVEAPAAGRLEQPQDTVEISSSANFVDLVHQLPDIREDRVAAIRAAIADGTYETADKLDTALSRMLDEFA